MRFTVLYKHYFLSFAIVLFLYKNAWSQLTVTNNAPYNSANYIVNNILLGSGITASNIVFKGTSSVQLGFFDGTNSNVGINQGIIISTGDIGDAIGPNKSGSTSTDADNILQNPSDPDLNLISTLPPVMDAAVLEFDFIPVGDSLIFKYVFASEEYPEYVNQMFNDVFGFFISGPGFNGPYSNGGVNIALVPGTNTPVAINNVNSGLNAQYYVDNGDGSSSDPQFNNPIVVAYDGLTKVMTARAKVQCGQTYHIRLGIADVGDDNWDSAVFLEAGSFYSPEFTVDVTTVSSDTTVIEGCISATFNFSRQKTSTQQIINYTITGNAINGTDYVFVPDSIIMGIGQSTASLTINPIADGINEGRDTVIITIYNITSCGDTIPEIAKLYIGDQYVLNTTINQPAPICLGNNVTLTSNVAGGVAPYTYSWSNNSVSTSITVSPTNTTVYSLTTTDSKGCQGTDSSTVTINPLPDVDAGSDKTVCAGAPISIGGNPTSTTGVFYNWLPANVLNSNSVANPIATVNNQTTFTLTVTDNNNCTKQDQITISIGTNALVDAGPNAKICVGNNITLGGNPTSTIGSVYTWSTENFINDSTSANPTFQSNQSGTFNYILFVTDAGNCTGTDTVKITVNNLPTINIGTNDTLCQGSTLVLGGNPTGPVGATYSWLPNNFLSNNNLPNPTTFTSQTITYSLTVTDTNLCSSTDSVTITSLVSPIIDAGINDSICIGDTIQLSGFTNGTSFSWQPAGLLNNPFSLNPIASILSSTTFTLTASNATCSSVDSIQIIIKQGVVVDAGINDSICFGLSKQLLATGAQNYNWLVSPFLNNTTISSPIATPTSTTTFYVIGSELGKCNGLDSVTIVVKPNPNVDAGVNKSVCEGTTVSLLASGANNYSWQTSATLNNYTIPNPTTVVTDTAKYFVTGTGSNGCKSIDSITIYSLPLPIVDAGIANYICKGSSTTLLASGAATYSWNTNPSLSNILIPNPIANPKKTTTYFVTGTDANGCKNKDSITVNVFKLFVRDSALCFGDSITLHSSINIGQATYNWSPGFYLSDSTIAQPKASPPATETYDLIATDTSGCSDTAIIVIDVYPNPITDFSITPFPTCDNIQAEFTSNSANAADYLWNFGDGTTSAETNPKHTFQFSNTYTISLTTTSANGCRDTLFRHINFTDFYSLLNYTESNVFTPNDDGINDLFQVKLNGKYLGCTDFKVYNRWGQIIFQSKKYNAAWDGTTEAGTLAPNDVYYYIFTIKDIELKGFVHLLR